MSKNGADEIDRNFLTFSFSSFEKKTFFSKELKEKVKKHIFFFTNASHMQ
jgi:hypothetical protein